MPEKVFKQTSEETNGELLEVESVYTEPTPSRSPVHYHPAKEETSGSSPASCVPLSAANKGR